jgi:hypothetical protein
MGCQGNLRESCNSDSREPFIEGGWAGGGWFHFRRDLGEEEGIFRRVFGVLGWGEWTKYDRVLFLKLTLRLPVYL